MADGGMQDPFSTGQQDGHGIIALVAFCSPADAGVTHELPEELVTVSSPGQWRPHISAISISHFSFLVVAHCWQPSSWCLVGWSDSAMVRTSTKSHDLPSRTLLVYVPVDDHMFLIPSHPHPIPSQSHLLARSHEAGLLDPVLSARLKRVWKNAGAVSDPSNPIP